MKKFLLVLSMVLITAAVFATENHTANGYIEIVPEVKWLSAPAAAEEEDAKGLVIPTVSVEGMNFFNNSDFGIYYGAPLLYLNFTKAEEGEETQIFIPRFALGFAAKAGAAYKRTVFEKGTFVGKLGLKYDNLIALNFLSADVHLNLYYKVLPQLSVKGGVSASLPFLIMAEEEKPTFGIFAFGIGAELGVAYTY